MKQSPEADGNPVRSALADLASGDLVAIANGTLTRVHPLEACLGRHCWVHDPSHHPLRSAQVAVVDGVALRLCDHWDLKTGRGAHPDPDDAWFRNRYGTKYSGWIDRAGEDLHTCCGERCCSSELD